eukprot:15061904-Alexandrium_andersonii.AAC.1
MKWGWKACESPNTSQGGAEASKAEVIASTPSEWYWRTLFWTRRKRPSGPGSGERDAAANC